MSYESFISYSVVWSLLILQNWMLDFFECEFLPNLKELLFQVGQNLVKHVYFTHNLSLPMILKQNKNMHNSRPIWRYVPRYRFASLKLQEVFWQDFACKKKVDENKEKKTTYPSVYHEVFVGTETWMLICLLKYVWSNELLCTKLGGNCGHFDQYYLNFSIFSLI